MTTELTKAAQQALECLRYLKDQSDCDVDPFRWMQSKGNAAIDALERALTQRPAAQTEREAFEEWYAEDANKQTGKPGWFTPKSIAELRDGDGYGEHRVMLNGKWEGWQARASLPAPQQATPASAPQSLLMRLAGIAAECSDPDTTDALDALIAATQQATPEPVGEPWGWAIEDKHGVAQAVRPARKEFFGCVQSTDPFTAEDIAKMDREWAGLAPHRLVTLYTAPPASQEQAKWTDADSDAARLALELECLLLDTKDTAAASRWWSSALEALELHRARINASQEQAAFSEALRSTIERSKAAPIGVAVEIDPLVSAEFRKAVRGEPSRFDRLLSQEQAQQPSKCGLTECRGKPQCHRCAVYERRDRQAQQPSRADLEAAAKVCDGFAAPDMAAALRGQQPSGQAWANETGLRQIECPSCGDLAVAYDPQQPSGEVVAVPVQHPRSVQWVLESIEAGNYASYQEAWRDLLTAAGADLATPKPEPMTWQPIATAPKDGTMFLGWVAAERWSSPDERSSSYAHDTSQVDFCWWRAAPPDPSPEAIVGGHFDNASGQIGDGQDITHWMPLPPAPITKGKA